jgi:polysaccharide pyruvyl transferase WcaK-like protein
LDATLVREKISIEHDWRDETGRLPKVPRTSRVLLLHSLARNHTNLGSQALSAGLRKALHETLHPYPLAVVEIGDPHLRSFAGQLSQFRQMEPDDALQAFEVLVGQLVDAVVRARGGGGLPFEWLLDPIRLHGPRNGLMRTRATRKLSAPREANVSSMRPAGALHEKYPAGCLVRQEELRPPDVSGLVHRDMEWARRAQARMPGLFGGVMPLQVASTFRLFDWAQVVLLDGDGNMADPFFSAALRALANMALAKSLGAAVYAVNHTMAVEDPTLLALVKDVYARIDGLVVREPKSKDTLLQIGIPDEKILVGADCASLIDDFNTAKADQLAAQAGITSGGIGLILRGDMSPDLEYWTQAVASIRDKLLKEVIYLSSNEKGDLDFGQCLAERTGLKLVRGLDDYAVFVPFIRHLDLILTQRYHPIYFAIMAGVPFVPLLGNTFKAVGLLQHFRYPCAVLESPSRAELIGELDKVLVQSNVIRSELPRVHRRLRTLAQMNVSMFEV